MRAAGEDPFSHERHGPLKLACAQCHPGAAENDRAGSPSLSQCRLCHPQRQSAPSARRLTRQPDFVIFSHAVHAKAQIRCGDCHGDPYRAEAKTVFRLMKMKECVDCHKQRRATETCNACHELGQ